jgi:hypothetical protein
MRGDLKAKLSTIIVLMLSEELFLYAVKEIDYGLGKKSHHLTIK